MKFLVLGASGMAGHLISIYLNEQGHKVVGYSRRKVPFVESIEGVVQDKEKLKKIITEGRFDTIINAIGILNQAAEADKESAVYVNSYLPHYLAKMTENMNTQIIHMSTDCVFSGKTGPYTEKSFRDGETFYDRTKAVGELEDTKNLTLRNSIIGPDINENGIGLLNWFMKQENPVNGYTGAIWTGLTTLELAKVMERAAEERIHGLINMVPPNSISKYRLLLLLNHYMKDDKVKINPYDAFTADKTLVRTNLEFEYEVPDYEKMVEDMASWIKEHRYLYPHYVL